LKNKILLLGNIGQLGWELHRSLFPIGEITALDFPQVDMANADGIRKIVYQIKPNLIVNATAYTNVNKAESEPELALAINGIGPGILAKAAKEINAGFIHFSTDYVFNGQKGTAYTEEDAPNPINVYGETKLAGEQAVQDVGGIYLIFRTSWVYSLRRPCFVTKFLQWAKVHETLRIVDDQVSSPTWARTLAESTTYILSQSGSDLLGFIEEHSGIFHLTNDGFCSRYDWTSLILKNYQDKNTLKVKRLERAKSIEFTEPAARPFYSVLDLQKVKDQFKLCIPDWDISLKLAMDYSH
jgi:dTDP-4-dehydrorhamnose reductase